MTLLEVLWLFLAGILGVVVACAIPYVVTVIGRVRLGSVAPPAVAPKGIANSRS